MKPTHSSIISVILIISLLLTGFGHPVFAQRSRPIVITFGQPNIWSLEQAHYLLARMHRQNLDLQTAPLGTLDPNATNASRIDILKTLLQAGVSFDQAVGLNNQLLRQDKTFNADRRRQLLNNRTSLQGESTQLARDISALKSDKARAATEAERTQIQDLIDAKTEQKAAVDNELTQTNDEAKGLTSASGEFQSATVPTDTFTPITGDLDSLISKVQLINPSIAAILRLDNHVQMQYEIISKQLTLLRDEVGPGERVVFLELPQSINATQDRAENKMAQTWWRIAGYTTVNRDMVFELELNRLSKEIDDVQQKIKAMKGIGNQAVKLNKAYASLLTKYERLKVERVRRDIRAKQETIDRLLQGGGAKTYDIVDQVMDILPGQAGVKKADYTANQKNADEAANSPSAKSMLKRCEEFDRSELNVKVINVHCNPRTFVNLEELNTSNEENQSSNETRPLAEVRKRTVRTIDIIPRQNAINVQDTKQRVARTGIFAAVSFLFGFAGKFTYERQREQAEQFLNQELFTSGFGKGEKDFGWSFYPFAGTKQLSSGVRTTYAVAIIPENAETLVLKARGCYFPRKKNQPLNYDDTGMPRWTRKADVDDEKCTPDEQVFVVPVPGGSGDGADYYVTDIRYSPYQQPGNRIVVSIGGQNLPSQVGILINGVPLREAVGLGQLNIESILGDDKTRDNCVGEICGRFERIGANQIIASFQTPPEFDGTPKIAIIGPGREIELNKLLLTVNGEEDAQLDDSDPMFGEAPDPPGSTLRRITDFKVAPTGGGSTTMTGVLTGSRFQLSDKIFVNGLLATKGSCRKDLCIVTFAPQETDFLTVTISPTSDAEKVITKTFVNPSNLSIISASVVSYEPHEGSGEAVLTVKLDGSGFNKDLKVSVITSEGPPVEPRIIVASAGQMFLKITQPEAVVRINVRDPANNRVVNAVVVRPEPPPKRRSSVMHCC